MLFSCFSYTVCVHLVALLCIRIIDLTDPADVDAEYHDVRRRPFIFIACYCDFFLPIRGVGTGSVAMEIT